MTQFLQPESFRMCYNVNTAVKTNAALRRRGESNFLIPQIPPFLASALSSGTLITVGSCCTKRDEKRVKSLGLPRIASSI